MNLAARLCDHAEPGQLLVQPSTALPAPRNLVVGNRALVTVRGFQAPTEVLSGQELVATPLPC